ncbi:thioesterase family protein [Pseudonocardia endophytica]|uniref:Thioesterase superfamily protein n=1 Tax=Pseudonocardia endophytica TaxID=401976 RepID=A0A4R1HTP1_PSEEN|nr:thioesterase family protein [Pseudonocardia endophytica]TCK24265.1 thioesterase superfamily protein [Pseudonocardia endophytica]
MTDLSPFYLPRGSDDDGEHFEATFSTTGPWFSDAQHMGPPSALLVRALERLDDGRAPDAPGLVTARVTVEILGKVPAGPVVVSAEVERPGRSIQMAGATMVAGGRPVLRARSWRLAREDTSSVTTGLAPDIPGPDTATVREERPDGWLPGYVDAMEWAWVTGWLTEPGPGRAWIRQRVPLVDGEEPSPLQRLMAVADSANGIAAPLDVRSWFFLNTELTVHLHRDPVGERFGLDAATVVGPSGLGTASAEIHDRDGHVGRISQALTVRPR